MLPWRVKSVIELTLQPGNFIFFSFEALDKMIEPDHYVRWYISPIPVFVIFRLSWLKRLRWDVSRDELQICRALYLLLQADQRLLQLGVSSLELG